MKVMEQALYGSPFGYADEIVGSFIKVYEDCKEVERLIMRAYDYSWEFTFQDDESLPLDTDPELRWRLYDMRNRATKLMRSMQRNLKAAKRLQTESPEIICMVLERYNQLHFPEDAGPGRAEEGAAE